MIGTSPRREYRNCELVSLKTRVEVNMARAGRSLTLRGEFLLKLLLFHDILIISDRFQNVRAQANGRINLALHGTNGFAPELMKRCVAAGVTKINVNRLVLDDYYDHLRANVDRMPHTQLIEEGIQKVADLTVKWMEISGSAGKAKRHNCI